MDTTIFAAIIGAVGSIAATWVARWPVKHLTASTAAQASFAEDDRPAERASPLTWKNRLGFLLWDATRLIIRNISIFVLFIVLIISLKFLGIGQPTPAVEAFKAIDQSVMLTLFVGVWSAGGLGVAEALTRWSPWKP